MTDARVKCAELATARGKTLVRGPSIGTDGCNVVFVHDGEQGVMEEGIYIRFWDVEALGPWPTVDDGFTAAQLRCRPA